MSNYRRWRVRGGTYFFTLVTYRRERFLVENDSRRSLGDAIRQVRTTHPFEVPAIVLLPDHLHLLMTLPPGDHDYSTRIRQIKTLFTRAYVQTRQPLHKDSHLARQEHPVWQRRFFEHTVRSGTDLTRCADYIHVNPLKHRLVQRVVDWPWSSFHRFLKQGHYGADWGSAQHWYGDEFTHFE